MRGHVDAESLALCAEGLLSRRRSERIRSHVASCPECAAMQARLTELPALLARVPAPSLPPGIEARLDAALSAEAARRAARDPGIVPDHPAPDRAAPDHAAPDRAARAPRLGTVPGPRAPRRRGLRLPVAARLLAAAGGVAVVAGVGYAVAQSSSSPSGSSSSSGAIAAPESSSASHPALHLPANGNGAVPGVTTFTVSHTGTRYRKGTFASQAATALANSAGRTIHYGAADPRHSLPGRTLTGCVDKVAGAGAGDVKLVDEARYEGHPATVIVVEPPAGLGRVYVAGTRCSASEADLLARAALP